MARRRLGPDMATVTQVLNYLDGILTTARPAEREALWDILTALRGPDNAASSKTHTVAVIRAAAFPRATSAGLLGETNPDATEVTLKGLDNHLAGHVIKAARALGLNINLKGYPAS